MINRTANGVEPKGRPPYDLLDDAIAARAAEVAIEREAQRLADEYEANPDRYTLAYGERSFELRPVAADLHAA
jgi:hypothetical protein